MELVKKIEDLLELKNLSTGWDGEGSHPISPMAILKAIEFLIKTNSRVQLLPSFVAPTTTDGVLLEYTSKQDNLNLTVYFQPDDQGFVSDNIKCVIFKNEKILKNDVFADDDFSYFLNVKAKFHIIDVFLITGRGTVLAGGILQGSFNVGDFIELNGKRTKITGIEGFATVHKHSNCGLMVRVTPEEHKELNEMKNKIANIT